MIRARVVVACVLAGLAAIACATSRPTPGSRDDARGTGDTGDTGDAGDAGDAAGAGGAGGTNEATLVLGGARVPVEGDVTIVSMRDAGGLDAVAAYRAHADDPDFTPSSGPRHVDGRALDPAEVAAHAAVVKRVVLKTDLAADAAAGFRASVARSVSAHLVIDFDGVVYQTLDLALAGRRSLDESTLGGPHDDAEVVIVLNNVMPSLARDPTAPPYPPAHARAAEQARHTRTKAGPRVINGTAFTSYGYTEAQYASLARVLVALAKVFPKIAVGVPRDASGAVPSERLSDWQARDGVLADWHTALRWAPGPGFDWSRLPF